MEKIYYNLADNNTYRADGSTTGNNNKIDFVFKTERQIAIQFLNTLTQNSNGEYTDVFTGWAGRSISASCAIDNNANHFFNGKLKTTITASTPVSTLDVDVISGIPRIAGTIVLKNSAGLIETVNYNTFENTESLYSFNLADANFDIADFSPVNDYAIDDIAIINELPIIKTQPSDIDLNDKDTGLIISNIDSNSLIFGDMIEGFWSIENPKMEIKIYDASATLEMAARWGVILSGILDDNGDNPPSSPVSDFFNKTESDGKYMPIDAEVVASIRYNATQTYSMDDFVSHHDELYYSIVDSNVGNTPDISPTKWQSFISSNSLKLGGNTPAELPISTLTQAGLDTKVTSVVAGDNITVDSTDPKNPIINATAGGGTGDMEKATYDTDDSGVVDNSEKLNNKEESALIVADSAKLDNKTPAELPVSTLTQDALDLKFNIADIVDNVTSTDTNKSLSANQGKLLNDAVVLKINKADIILGASSAMSDETTDITTDNITTFRSVTAFTLNEVRININEAPVGSTIIVDVKIGGTSIFSTLVSIDTTEKTSVTAAIPAVITTTAISDDTEFVATVTQIGSTTAGKGLKIALLGEPI